MINVGFQEPGLGERMQKAVQAGESNFRTGLIKFLALEAECTEYDDQFKAGVIECSEVLGNVFPSICTK